jgi:hypothetical protein
MPLPRSLPLVLIALPLLAACSTSAATVKSTPAKPAISAPAALRTPGRRPPPPRPQLQVLPGLEGVIGANADDLVSQFGPARLDVWEGDARKLQFVSKACVLDIYLYPAGRGDAPQASYIDARRASDGQEVDRAACVAALRGR